MSPKRWGRFSRPSYDRVGAHLAQVSRFDVIPIIQRRVHPLFRLIVPLCKAALDGTRRTVICFEVYRSTVINVRSIKLRLIELAVFRRGLFALFVEEVIVLHGREPSLTTPQTADPRIAVNHLVLDHCVLDTIAAYAEYRHVASRNNPT